ncbi:MAG: hypothetical protein R2932_36930 [Caldilineaceae bacterium]
MQLDYVPLLHYQRDFYTKPRGFDRFWAYIDALTDADGDMALPISAMNPMGKDHLLPYLEQLVTMDADAIGARATVDAGRILADQPGAFRVTTIISDDQMGGWTNRYVSEFHHRFRTRAYDRRGWTAPILWSSETYSPAQVYQQVSAAIYRLAYVQQHGYAQTLGEMLRQEGYAMKMAGMTEPLLDQEDLAYTQFVLAEYRERSGEPIVIPALFGDPAAHQLGYTPLGLSPCAGFALALDEARQSQFAHRPRPMGSR